MNSNEKKSSSNRLAIFTIAIILCIFISEKKEEIKVTENQLENTIHVTETSIKSAKIPTQPPNIKITSNNQTEPITNYFVLKTQWNGSIYDRLSVYQTVWKNDKIMTNKYSAKIDEVFNIDFSGYEPDKVEIKMEYLTKSTIASELPTEEISIVKNGDVYEFINQTKTKTDIQTFGKIYIISALWGENSCEYAFVNFEDLNENTKNDIGTTIESKLETIINNPEVQSSSNPYDYTKSQEYRDIINLGDNGLKNMLSEFENSKDNGLREYVMAIACSEILKENTENKNWETGREWYDNYTRANK